MGEGYMGILPMKGGGALLLLDNTMIIAITTIAIAPPIASFFQLFWKKVETAEEVEEVDCVADLVGVLFVVVELGVELVLGVLVGVLFVVVELGVLEPSPASLLPEEPAAAAFFKESAVALQS